MIIFIGATVSLTVQRVSSVPAGFLKKALCREGLLQLFNVIFVAAWVCAASGCAWLDVKQRQAIYRPTQGVPANFEGLRAGDERYFLDVPQSAAAAPASSAAQRVEIWWLPHADIKAPTLLYFHGTFRNLYENARKIDSLRAAGFAVLAVDYRGWGVSTPITPSEQTILQDADIAWAELQRREPRPAQRVLYGHSMGSGVAVDLASRLRAGPDYGGLILESALSSFSDVAREAGLMARLVAGFLSLANEQRFASIDKIGKVTAPLLMIHGSADTTITPRLGRRLFDAANAPKQWLVIDGGAHSDVDDIGRVQYQASLQDFMRRYLAAP
jgi:uncharacterized protein